MKHVLDLTDESLTSYTIYSSTLFFVFRSIERYVITIPQFTLRKYDSFPDVLRVRERRRKIVNITS